LDHVWFSKALQISSAMRIFLLKVALALAWAHQALAIYADDHWNYSTKLSEENFDSFVQGGIDSGKTVVSSRMRRGVALNVCLCSP
jgi:hypothetical protein